MFRVFDRYLLKEVINGWLAVTLFLWLILVSNRLVDYLGDAVSGDIPANLIFKLIGLKMVWYLVHVVPFALALGVVLALGRLYRNNEMTVMSACGVGPWNIYKPLLSFGIVIAIILAWLSLYVSPEVQGMSNRLEELAKQQAGLTLLGPGRFNELQGGRLIFYAERLSADKQNMENLFIVLRNRKKLEKLPQLLTARSAYRKLDDATGDSFLVLVDGYRYEGKPGDANYRIMAFTEYGVRIALPGEPDVQEIQESVPSAALMRSLDPKDIAELQWRLAMPVSVIVLLLLAVPLCKSSPRQGHYGRLVVSILLFFIYYNLLATAKYWVGEGVGPAVIGLWWVPVLPILLMIVLLNSERILCLFRARR
ncbi:MAG: LPS export ABC transporter permease LptF [Gammaproteobacteria bacterium]|nr:LPS export ABC transporter permease LptF [Gammaproteobacteria bacterium]